MNLLSVFLPSDCASQTITEAIESSHNNQETVSSAPNGYSSTDASLLALETESAPSVLSDPSEKDISYAVQTGYFLSESNASRQVAQLKSQGLNPYIFQSVNAKGKQVFSVRIGKFESYSEADKAISEFKKSISTPMIVTRFDSLQTSRSTQTKKSEVIEAPAVNSREAATQTIVEPQSKDSDSTFAKNNIEPAAPAHEEFVAPQKPLTMEEMQQKLQMLEQTMQRMKGESDIRSQLKITEEEAAAEEEDILEAAGQEYTLTRAGNIKFSYGLGYSYQGYDAIREGARIEDVANHTLSNSFGVSYGVKNNLSVGTSIPFVYSYYKLGTVDSMDATDLGDISLNWQFQPIKSSADIPTIIINGSLGIPVGKNPYEIQPGEELSTSSGIYDAGLGVSFSQVTDPVIAFSSFSVSYPFATQSIDQKRAEGTLDEVDPGMGLGASVGLGYALSYKLNLNMSFSYSYSFSTTYKYQNSPDAKTGDSTGASINIGTGYKFSQNQNMNFTIGIPITSTRSFSLSFSTPVDFAL